MKRRIIVFAALLFTLEVANAQSTIGLIVGASSSNLKSQEFLQTNDRTGFAFGGIIDLWLYDKSEFRIMPMFVQRGARLKDPSSVKFNLDYFEVPVLIKYSLSETRFRPYFIGGLSTSIVIKANIVAPGLSTIETELLKDLDLGGSFGAGLQWEISRYHVFIEGRYTIGLVNINEDINRLGFNEDIKTRSFQLSLGILFPPKNN